MFRSNPIPAREPVIVSVSLYNGKARFDIRHYYFDENIHALAPTQKGVNVPIEDAIDLIDIILAAIDNKTVSIASREKLPAVSVSLYNGKARFDIRHYWTPRGTSVAVPTKKGVSLPISSAGQLKSALLEAKNAISGNKEHNPSESKSSEADILNELGFSPADDRFQMVEV